MNTDLRPAHWQELLKKLNRWSGKPAAEWAGRLLLSLAAGLALAGVRIGTVCLPLPVCLSAALGLSAESFAAYAGGCLGYAMFWGIGRGLEPMAAGLLIQACYCIFGDELVRENRWLSMAMSMVFTALVGFFALLEQRFAAAALGRWIIQIAAAGGGTVCLQMTIVEEDRLCGLVTLALLCGGLCVVAPSGIPLGAIAACTLAASALHTGHATIMAAFCGLALDLCWGPYSATAILVLASLLCRGEQWFLRLAGWLACVLAGVLVTGSTPILLAAAMIGTALSRLVPQKKLYGVMPDLRTREEKRLAAAAGLLDQMRQCLETGRRSGPDPETAAVFDQAADRICRMCGLYQICWEENSEDTCEALNRATPAMMERGQALREDFPPLFVKRCRHLDGFLNAVNRELDDLSCRRQYRNRIKESRLVLSQQYGVLSQALLRKEPDLDPERRFRAEVGFRSRGRRGDSVTGDQGASFQLGGAFFMVLCDGMGTGASAAAEAGAAIAIVRTLLQAGTEPGQALEVLNGIYILRDDGGFATVDLLRADLETGEAVLYKWGSAPSYWKDGASVEKIGTASPPPGLGVGEGHQPEEVKLSFAKGEMLVLVSDGVGGEGAETLLRQSEYLSPKELASGIINCTQDQGEEDDRTAAVIALRPCIRF